MIDLENLRIECFAEGATLIGGSIWHPNHETSLVSANLAVVFEKSGSHIVTSTDQIFSNLILHPRETDAKNEFQIMKNLLVAAFGILTTKQSLISSMVNRCLRKVVHTLLQAL